MQRTRQVLLLTVLGSSLLASACSKASTEPAQTATAGAVLHKTSAVEFSTLTPTPPRVATEAPLPPTVTPPAPTATPPPPPTPRAQVQQPPAQPPAPVIQQPPAQPPPAPPPPANAANAGRRAELAAQLTALEARIATDQKQLESLKFQIAAYDGLLKTLKSDLDTLYANNGGDNMVEPHLSRYESLRIRYNETIDFHNALIATHNHLLPAINELIRQQQAWAAEYNSLR